ncbi:MAG: CIA30 family protein [Pseudomonadota bacterium]
MARDYISDPEGPWRFVSDQVMGGVSTGRAERLEGAIHLSGRVSTENRGGFIQVRMDLAAPFPTQTSGLRLEVRGNGERYFVHLRTRGSVLPWQYYQAGFPTGPDWSEVRLPFASFAPSGLGLRRTPNPASVVSIGLVAFGRDHDADLFVRSVEAYAD